MNKDNSLWDLKLGAIVIICYEHSQNEYSPKSHYYLSHVSKVTPTLIECDNYQFRKKDGKKRGKPSCIYQNISVKRYDKKWWKNYIMQKKAEEEHRKLVDFVSQRISNLSTDQLKAIKDIIGN